MYHLMKNWKKGVRMAIYSRDQMQIYFERGRDHGQSGDPLLFISGTGGDLRNKPNQFDSPLAKSFELIAYDQRGLGQTSKPEGDYSMREYADDAASLLDHLNLDRVPVVGVSFGGMVAQEFVLRHPDRVSRVVLACTSSGGKGNSSYPLHEIEKLDSIERASKHLEVSDLRRDKKWQQENPEKWQHYIELAVSGRRSDRDQTGATKQLMARKEHDTFDRLSQIEIPVLVVGGKYDGVAPVENMKAIAGQIQSSEFRFYEGGHMFLVQDREAYPEIIEWLKR